MSKNSVYHTNKATLIHDIKEWLKYIPSSYVEFKEGKNNLKLYYFGELVSHTLISIEWVKHDDLDYIEVLSFNDNYDPNELTPDSDDLSNFELNEIKAIYKLAQSNAKQFVK